MEEIIHCIGDSHASFFSGRNPTQPAWPLLSDDIIPSFRSYRLGAVLAYSLPELDSSTKGREKLLDVLKSIPKGSRVMLCFGEIDCRVHLLKQAEKQNRNIENVIDECVERYFSVVKDVKEDFEVLIWGVVPSTPSETTVDPRYPHYGTNVERNHVTKLFNAKLQTLCLEYDVKFLSIFEKLIKEGGATNKRYFGDQVHLSQKAMPVALRELGNVLPEFKVVLFRGIINSLPYSVSLLLFTLKSEINSTLYYCYRNGRSILGRILRRKPTI